MTITVECMIETSRCVASLPSGNDSMSLRLLCTLLGFFFIFVAEVFQISAPAPAAFCFVGGGGDESSICCSCCGLVEDSEAGCCCCCCCCCWPLAIPLLWLWWWNSAPLPTKPPGMTWGSCKNRDPFVNKNCCKIYIIYI